MTYLILLAPLVIGLLLPPLLLRRRRKPDLYRDLGPPAFGFVTGSGLDLEPEHPDCVWLPRSFLTSLIANPTFSSITRYERDTITDLADDIHENGIKEPLIIVIDGTGVCLRDGHHRVVTGAREHYPVALEHSERIRKHKVPLKELVDLLWDDAKGTQV